MTETNENILPIQGIYSRGDTPPRFINPTSNISVSFTKLIAENYNMHFCVILCDHNEKKVLGWYKHETPELAEKHAEELIEKYGCTKQCY